MKIIAVGKIKEDYLKKGCEDFAKRINYYDKIDILEVKNSDSIMEKIGDEFVIAMSEEGDQFSSEKFSEFLRKINKNITFIIGDFDGIPEKVKKRADKIVSLSDMTFTHEMARLFLLEQIYRHEMIIHNKKYHR